MLARVERRARDVVRVRDADGLVRVGEERRERLGGLVAVELEAPEPHAVAEREHLVRGHVRDDADDEHPITHRVRDRARLVLGDAPRALRDEVDADRVRAFVRAHPSVTGARHSANLDAYAHAPISRSSLTFAMTWGA